MTTTSNSAPAGGFPRHANTHLGLLVLRVVFGVSLAVLHGWGKAATLLAGDGAGFPSVLGIPPTVSLVLAVLAEVVAALLVAIGMLTRAAATYLGIYFVITVLVMHGGALTGEDSGELAFLMLAAFAAVAIAGPGRYSVDGLPRMR